MYLSLPAGAVESTQSEPSGAAAAKLATPGICVQLVPWIALCGFTVMMLAGRITVCAIGAGGIRAGEIDAGVFGCNVAGRGLDGNPEQPLANANPKKAPRTRQEVFIGQLR